MTEIKKAENLVAVSVRQGLQMNLVEADIVLGYIEGHGFALMSDEKFQMALHDLSLLTGTDFDYVFYVVDKDLSVTNLAGIQNFARGMDHLRNRDLTDYDGHLNDRQHSGLDFRAAEIPFRLAALLAAAHNICRSHAGDADIEHSAFQSIKPLHFAENIYLCQLYAVFQHRLRARRPQQAPLPV